MNKSINTGIRLTESQFEKLDRMAGALRTNRNRVIGMLVDAAQVEQTPAVSVKMNNNRVDAKALSGQNVNTVRA